MQRDEKLEDIMTQPFTAARLSRKHYCHHHQKHYREGEVSKGYLRTLMTPTILRKLGPSRKHIIIINHHSRGGVEHDGRSSPVRRRQHAFIVASSPGGNRVQHIIHAQHHLSQFHGLGFVVDLGR